MQHHRSVVEADPRQRPDRPLPHLRCEPTAEYLPTPAANSPAQEPIRSRPRPSAPSPPRAVANPAAARCCRKAVTTPPDRCPATMAEANREYPVPRAAVVRRRENTGGRRAYSKDCAAAKQIRADMPVRPATAEGRLDGQVDCRPGTADIRAGRPTAGLHRRAVGSEVRRDIRVAGPRCRPSTAGHRVTGAQRRVAASFRAPARVDIPARQGDFPDTAEAASGRKQVASGCRGRAAVAPDPGIRRRADGFPAVGAARPGSARTRPPASAEGRPDTAASARRGVAAGTAAACRGHRAAGRAAGTGAGQAAGVRRPAVVQVRDHPDRAAWARRDRAPSAGPDAAAGTAACGDRRTAGPRPRVEAARVAIARPQGAAVVPAAEGSVLGRTARNRAPERAVAPSARTRGSGKVAGPHPRARRIRPGVRGPVAGRCISPFPGRVDGPVAGRRRRVGRWRGVVGLADSRVAPKVLLSLPSTTDGATAVAAAVGCPAAAAGRRRGVAGPGRCRRRPRRPCRWSRRSSGE